MTKFPSNSYESWKWQIVERAFFAAVLMLRFGPVFLLEILWDYAERKVIQKRVVWTWTELHYSTYFERYCFAVVDVACVSVFGCDREVRMYSMVEERQSRLGVVLEQRRTLLA